MNHKKLPVSDLSAHIEMGQVELNVLNLRIMKHYYSDLAGLQVLSETESNVVLGYNERPILHLSLTPNLSHPLPDDAGLYHTAILYESRAVLHSRLSVIMETLVEGVKLNPSIVGDVFTTHLLQAGFLTTEVAALHFIIREATFAENLSDPKVLEKLRK
jgi:hypothetical protein